MATLDEFKTLNEVELSAVEGGGKGVCRFVMAGANGYACRYSNGEWGYIVTKSNFEAARDVVIKGWMEHGPWIPRPY